MAISHHKTPCKNKLDASNFLCKFYVAWGFRLRMELTYETEPQRWYKCYQVQSVNWIYTMVRETDTRKATCAKQVARQAWSKSHVRWHVRLARAASSHHTARCKVHKAKDGTSTNAHKTIVFYSCNRSTHRQGSDTTDGFVAWKTKKFYRKNKQNPDLI